ncbi:unnamed protein product [Umbelopsis vinacea]
MFAFKRSANRAVTLLNSRAFTSASSPKSRIRPLPVALGALAGSSLTAYYYMNTVDYHPVALTSDENYPIEIKLSRMVLQNCNLTATTLRGKDKVVISPLVFYTNDHKDVTIVVHLGRSLCGHDKIVHGGMLAVLLDEALACVALPALPFKTGFTANLNIDYRLPVKADQWVVLRGKLIQQEGRKAWVEGWIESADGEHKFTEAKSLYISPKAPF